MRIAVCDDDALMLEQLQKHIRTYFEKIGMKCPDSLFCNLLDNAYEAACGIPEAFIEVSTGGKANTPLRVISVVNSSRKNPFAGTRGSLATTKAAKQGHGLGLKSIRKTVCKYHGDMQMYYQDDTLTFHTVITLKSSI